MAEQLHLVDLETCTGDGLCAEVCPEDALEMVDEKAATVESRADSCILCGQCVAVCPTESLEMPKLPMEDFHRLNKMPFGYDEFSRFSQVAPERPRVQGPAGRARGHRKNPRCRRHRADGHSAPHDRGRGHRPSVRSWISC